MADRIRKLGRWIWMNKERMVLLIMLGVLVYQVYQVFNPPEPPRETLLRSPVSTLDHLAPEARPPIPPLPPTLLIPGQYANMWRNNPFWVHASGGTGTDTEDDIFEQIRLVDIMDTGSRKRARLRTASTSKWYDEGDRFEQFTLESIDSEAESVVVFAESARQRVTIEMEQ